MLIWTSFDSNIGQSFQICGGLPNLENCILSSTLEDRLLCKGLNPVRKDSVGNHSHLRACFLDPSRSGCSESFVSKGSEGQGFKFHYPARGRKLYA